MKVSLPFVVVAALTLTSVVFADGGSLRMRGPDPLRPAYDPPIGHLPITPGVIDLNLHWS